MAFQGWRFDLTNNSNNASQKAGLQLTAQGKIAMTRGAELIKQSIHMLLATVQGERVMYPDYGCKLNHLVFAKNDNTTAGLAIHYVSQALERWEPRIDIVHIDATYNQYAPEQLDISIKYRIKTTHDTDELLYSFNMEGAIN